jgi:tRNA(Ile)-lysidine synthase
MDDQAETVLIKVILGGSINGLSGIPPVRYEGRVRIVRPLIRVEREEILDLLDEQGQGYMTDSTNRDTDILRNSVRLEVIPFLIQYNPSLKRSLVNIADTLREDAEVLKAVGRKKSCLTPMDFKNGKVGIRLADILIQPAAVRKELCKKAFASAGGNVKKLTYRHWIKIDRFLRRSDPGSNLDLPGKITLEKKRAGILFRASETG